MIEAMVLILLVMAGVTSSGSIGLSPVVLADVGILEGSQPQCRPRTPEEHPNLGKSVSGKVGFYGTDVQMVCERQVFDYGERDSFFDFVASVAPKNVEMSARRFAQLQQSNPHFAQIFAVQIQSDEPMIQQYLEHLVRTEFSGYLKAGAISNMPASEHAPALIKIEVRRVDDRDLVLTTSAVIQRDGRIQRWAL